MQIAMEAPRSVKSLFCMYKSLQNMGSGLAILPFREYGTNTYFYGALNS